MRLINRYAITTLILLSPMFSTGCSAKQTTEYEHSPDSSNQSNAFSTFNKIAFTNVGVVSMEEDKLMDNMTLLIEDGVIKALKNSSTSVPEGYKVINGARKYIMPALADMHTHAIEDNDMFLYLANGVTKVRHMWGGNRSLALKERIKTGEVLGPLFYAASPGFEEPPSYWPGPVLMEDIDQVEGLVLDQKEKGFDFIKAYSNMSLSMYKALLSAATKHDIKVIGHISPEVGIQHALANRHSSIAHIDGYLEYAAKERSDINSPSSYQLDEGKLEEIIDKTVEAGVWNCPTITITTRNLSQKSSLEKDPALRFVSPNMRRWFTSPGTGLNTWESEAYTRHKKAVIRKMNEKGAKLLLGVDTGLRYLMPGFTVHEELENFVSCGLSPFEALRTATINPALFLEIDQDYGTISVGKKADFILLSANPLVDIRNTQKIEGVLMKTLWMSKSEIDKKLEEIASSY